VVPLGVLSQGGEGVERIATTMVPKGEALCLWEGPDFHAGSQGLVFCSRKKCGICFKGRPLSLLGIFRKGLRRGLALAEGGHAPLVHILEESVHAHGSQPLLGVGYVLLLRGPPGDLGDSWLATVAPVGDDACFALAYAAIAILVLDVDSGGDHLGGRAHYSGVDAGVRSPGGLPFQLVCHCGPGLLLREVSGKVIITKHM
jgi:hypothetical protein